MSNPYASPHADVSSHTDGDETYTPKAWAMSGRIGRVRYLAYAIGLPIAIIMGAGVVAALAQMHAIGMALASLLYIAAIFISFLMAVRRLNDLNQSGWWSLLSFVPFVNFFFGIYILFFPGTAGRNNYGPAPTKNTGGVIALACVLPVFIAIIAAVAIPAYHEYVEKAKAAQTRMDEKAAAEAVAEAAAEAEQSEAAEPAAELEEASEAATETEPAPEPAPEPAAEPAPAPAPR